MLAVVFPGQGSQAPGMSLDFAERHPEARAVLDEAEAALALPLTRWLREGDEEQLRRTEIAQPAILAASIAIYRAIEPRLPVAPALLAGHSLGEYSALVAAGSLGLAEAVRLVRRRGELMQEAVPEGRGAMAAVLGLDAADVARVCAGVAGHVAPANFNAPTQTVIAGEREAVDAARAALVAAGARRVIGLEVSAPFHCALMTPAMEKLTPALAEACFRDLRVPVVSNVTATVYRSGEEARRLLREQVCAPVRWVDCVRALVAAGVRVQLEVGPGEVLSGLAARIDRALGRAHVAKLEDVETALARVREGIAA
jgi:[acyl-carrier-protein] S-malonyltransferase